MTLDLNELLDNSFFLINYVGIQPSEIDKLSVYEMRSFIQLALEHKKREMEQENNRAGMLSKLFSLSGKKK